jgi:UDP-2,3-diacylglucosamine pyrophosphatase LpxH
MLVFVSDLHFVDETAGEHNVPTAAFEIFLQGISRAASRLIDDGRDVEEIKIVFLGDIFDLLRTEKWFPFPEAERPWGSNEKKIEEHAKAILDAIVMKNKNTFDLLGGELKNKFDFPVEPERIYVPGNHDRLCNKYGSLRRKVCKNLGIPPSRARFAHNFEDVAYGVFARHGHEYDKFNYEGGTSYDHNDYMRMPIGDPITTELVARLPWKVMRQAAVKNLPKAEQKALRRNLEEIVNVRPYSSILEWLLYQVKKNLFVKEAIEDSVDEVIGEFNKLKFVKKWYRHHDKWTDFRDEADQIQAFLFLLEKFKIFPSERLLPLLELVRKHVEKDPLSEAAQAEYLRLDSRIRYVVYGHSHQPLQMPVRVVGSPESMKEQVYLNTGTWRRRYHKTEQGLGFIGWKNMTYIVFYRKEEKGLNFPAFATWTGTLKTI